MTVEELKRELDRFPDDMEVYYFFSTGYINNYVPVTDLEERKFNQDVHPEYPAQMVLMQSV